MDAAPLVYDASAAHGPRAIVYTRDEDARGVIRQALNNLGASDAVFKSDGAHAALADLAGNPSPPLLIVDVSGEHDPLARVRELIEGGDPSTAVVVIGDTNDIRLYRDIRDAGAAEYFFKPLATALVAETCGGILSGTTSPGRRKIGRLVFVVGALGGSGATTLAVRSAWRLSSDPPRPVVMIDLDLQSGDVALQLDVTPNQALTEALVDAERVDELFLERGLIHVTRRLDLLASLEALETPSEWREDALLSLLNRIATRYQYVVVDVPARLASGLARVLHMPSTLLLVSDGRLVSAREVARWRELLGPNSAERTTLHVLNMSGAPGSLPVAEFTRAAGQAPDVIIPYVREVAESSLLGVKASPGCPSFDRHLELITSALAGDTPHPRPSMLRRVLG